jgi:PBP1b-binding outer membrane lipoprotein LpoB|tara:strand:- start:68 stop:679 length:612 start_codon:yes stop_codon:yes gene_type:complete
MKNPLLLSFLITMIITSCGERRPVGRAADARYLEDGSNKGLVNLEKINAQDFTRAANQLIGDLLSSNALIQAPTQPAILHVGEVKNDTQTYFDTDLLLQGMKRDLIATNRVRISTTAGPGGKGADSYAQEVRGDLESKGKKINRPRPYFSLSGKIIEETSRVDKVTQKDFYFLLTLTEINSGTGVWFGRELITKQGSRGAIGF